MNQEIKGLNHRKVGRYIVCITLCFISIFPFYIMIVNSTLASKDITTGLKFLPGSEFFNNLKTLLSDSVKQKTGGLNVLQAMLNSLIVTVPSTILQVYFGSLTAYAVTVYNFRGKRFVWAFIYGIMMIPTQVSVVGFVKLCSALHLDGTFWPLIIPSIAAPTTIYFMKQYMETGLSKEIVEAARIDGSSEFATFNRIVLPLLKPAMATQAIFGFVASWNNLYVPSIILATEPSKSTMPVYISKIKANDKDRDWGMIYCALFATVLPILIMYFFLSKYIIAGVALGGVKE